MAGAAGARGRRERAARLWGAAEALREEIGVPLQPEDRMVLDPYLATARSSLGEIAWQTALVEGRAMTPERAIEYALYAGEPASPPPAAHRSGENSTVLTPREEEVAVLVSRAHQPPDRLGALHLRAHGRHPHYQDPQEARPELPLPALRLGGRTRVVPIGQEQLASLAALNFQQTKS